MFLNNKTSAFFVYFCSIYDSFLLVYIPDLGTFECWISGFMLDPLFFLISRLNNACYPLVINLQIN